MHHIYTPFVYQNTERVNKSFSNMNWRSGVNLNGHTRTDGLVGKSLKIITTQLCPLQTLITIGFRYDITYCIHMLKLVLGPTVPL